MLIINLCAPLRGKSFDEASLTRTMRRLFFKLYVFVRPLVYVDGIEPSMFIRRRPAAPVRKGSTMDYKRIANAPKWVASEIIWYIKWWLSLFYSLGEWILNTSAFLIDLHDEFWDAAYDKLRGEDNVLV